jgi:hypothetical protein
MVMMLDAMASRYHLLPSEVLQRATTIDLNVLERSMQYRNEMSDPDRAKRPPKLTQEQMLAMLDQVKKVPK